MQPAVQKLKSRPAQEHAGKRTETMDIGHGFPAMPAARDKNDLQHELEMLQETQRRAQDERKAEIAVAERQINVLRTELDACQAQLTSSQDGEKILRERFSLMEKGGCVEAQMQKYQAEVAFLRGVVDALRIESKESRDRTLARESEIHRLYHAIVSRNVTKMVSIRDEVIAQAPHLLDSRHPPQDGHQQSARDSSQQSAHDQSRDYPHRSRDHTDDEYRSRDSSWEWPTLQGGDAVSAVTCSSSTVTVCGGLICASVFYVIVVTYVMTDITNEGSAVLFWTTCLLATTVLCALQAPLESEGEHVPSYADDSNEADTSVVKMSAQARGGSKTASSPGPRADFSAGKVAKIASLGSSVDISACGMEEEKRCSGGSTSRSVEERLESLRRTAYSEIL